MIKTRADSADLESTLDRAGLINPAVRDFVRYWAHHTGASQVEVVGAADDARLVRESLAAGEILPAGDGRYYARSYVKDTARSEERTIVATARPGDKGVYNNWRSSGEMRPLVTGLMRDASADKTMYVVPYLMAPPGSPLAPYAAGVELTDHRTVALHMIRMARCGVEYVNSLPEPGRFVRGVHVTGDLPNLGQGTPDDQRYFVTVADERTILHYGSSYGGNALLGKIAHGLRQASYDGWVSEEFLAEQFMLIGITDKQTGRTWHICGGFPSASGKTNLAMMLAPDSLGERYHVSFYGDDIAWLQVDPEDGSIYAINPEFGVFGVAKDTKLRVDRVDAAVFRIDLQPCDVVAIKRDVVPLTQAVGREHHREVGLAGRAREAAADVPRATGLLVGDADEHELLGQELLGNPAVVGRLPQPMRDFAEQGVAAVGGA